MPKLDAYIPEGALDPDAELALARQLTDILLEEEGADPSNEQARSIAWVSIHRPALQLVGGSVPDRPRYQINVSVPEGQLDRERRQSMVARVTDAVLAAEGPDSDGDKLRVWVFAGEIPEGTWGGAGQIFGLAEISSFVLGDPEAGRAHAQRRLASRKAEREAIFS
ncbi:tautomerase family protein [Euzebya tangerina]|uniref:tautomerase family protein n=1 Tax=Euzebya tangerina TaxID=591198 RepID=UPI000E3112BD|nr:tautomerase family protein [Euzebya tangerina]